MVISENNIDGSTRKLQFQQAQRLFEKIKKINDEIDILSMGMSMIIMRPYLVIQIW